MGKRPSLRIGAAASAFQHRIAGDNRRMYIGGSIFGILLLILVLYLLFG